FFALSGLRTNIGLLNEAETWLWLFVVIAVACVGKLFGSAITARLMRMSWRESFSIGVLMNTKGLVELIVLNIGYDTHVINDRIFLIMVVMALVTTFMTTPIISVIYTPKHYGEPEHTVKAKDRKLSRINSSESTNRFDHRKVSAVEILPDSIKEPMKMLIYLDDLEPVPSIARLIWLFKPERFEDNILSFSALKVLEPSERSSSVMIASQIDEAVKTDPALNMINLFGTLINVNTSSFVTMSSVEDIGEEVNHISNRENCSLIVLPWNNRLVIGSILSSSPQEKIRNIINASDVPTATFVPKTKKNESGPPASYKKVVVIFFGGPDDREALNIGLRIYRHGAGLKVVVLNVVYRMPRKLDSNMNPVSAMSSPDLTDKVFPPATYPVTHHESISTVREKRSSIFAPHPAAIRSTVDDDLLEMVKSLIKLKPNSSTLELIDLETENVVETAVEECLSRQPDLCIFGHKQNFVLTGGLQGFVNEIVPDSGQSLDRVGRPASPSATCDHDVLKAETERRKTSVNDLEKQVRKHSSSQKTSLNSVSPTLSRIMMHRSISHSSNLTPTPNNAAMVENDVHVTAPSAVAQAASNLGHFYASMKRRKPQTAAVIRKCTIVTEILGHFGQQLYDDSDLNSSLLVISRNHLHTV
uniref:Cation/H+ exchanger domain-containing protein n=1 Tax=Romanomermis culicivorax TaxID=13658 RepID=A0A915ITU1_ROMCU